MAFTPKKIYSSNTPGQAPSSGTELAQNFNDNFDAVKSDLEEKDKKIVQLEQESSTSKKGISALESSKANKADTDLFAATTALDLARIEREKATKQELENASIQIQPNSVTKESLSDSVLQFIESSGGGSVTNNADDEDLEVKSDRSTGVLKLKDRKYDRSAYSGKGYKIVRKRIVSGKNLLEQLDLIADTTHVIRYDFDLNGATITIPEGALFEFAGGSFKNGTITTPIRLSNVPEYQIFYDCNVKIASGLVKVLWFGAKGDGTNAAIPIQQAIAAMMDGCTLQFESVEYTHGDGTNPDYPRDDKGMPTGPWDIGTNWRLTIKDLRAVIIDGCNCIIRSHPLNTPIAYNGMFEIVNCHFSEFKRFTIDGNKNIRNVLGTDLSGYNGQSALSIVSCTNLQVRNVHSINAMMDAICVSSDIFKPITTPVVWAENILIEDGVFDNAYRQGCSIVNAKRVIFQRCRFTNTGVGKGTMPMLGLDFEEGYNSAHGRGQYDCVVRECYFEGNVTGGCAFHYGSVRCTAENNIFVENSLYDVHDSITGGHKYIGNRFIGGRGITVDTVDCVVYNNTLSTLFISKNTKAYGNTINANNTGAKKGVLLHLKDNVTFENNTIINPYRLEDNKPNVFIFDGYTKGRKLIQNNNIYYTPEVLEELRQYPSIGRIDVENEFIESKGNTVALTGVPAIDNSYMDTLFSNDAFGSTDLRRFELIGNKVLKIKPTRAAFTGVIKTFVNPKGLAYSEYLFTNGVRVDKTLVASRPLVSDLDSEGYVYIKNDNINWRIVEFSSTNSMIASHNVINIADIPDGVDFTPRPSNVNEDAFKYYDFSTEEYFTLKFPLAVVKAGFTITTSDAYYARWVPATDFVFTTSPDLFKLTDSTLSNKELLFLPYVSKIENGVVHVQIRNRRVSETAIRTKLNIVNGGVLITPSVITIESRVFDETLDADKYNFLYTGKRTVASYSQLSTPISSSYTGFSAGSESFVKEDNIIVRYDGNVWRHLNGYIAAKIKGSTDQRPSLSETDGGFEYYDTSLKKKIVWNGTAWTNLDGTALV